MARPNWTYIRVDNQLPEHPKLDDLTAQSRMNLLGSLIEALSYCSRHLTDGFISESKWKSVGTVVGRRLMIARGFAAPSPGGYQIHDYLEHQLSKAKVEAASKRGKNAAVSRHHGDATRTAECTADRIADRSADRTASSRAEVEVEVENPPSPPSRRTASRTRRAADEPANAARPQPSSLAKMCRRCGSFDHPTDKCPTGHHPPEGQNEDTAKTGAALARELLGAREVTDEPERPTDTVELPDEDVPF